MRRKSYYRKLQKTKLNLKKYLPIYKKKLVYLSDHTYLMPSLILASSIKLSDKKKSRVRIRGVKNAGKQNIDIQTSRMCIFLREVEKRYYVLVPFPNN